MARKDCIDQIAEGSGLSREEALDAAEQANDVKESLAAAGHTDKLKARTQQAIARRAQNAKIAAAMQKRHAALNIIKRQEIDNHIDTLVAGGLREDQAVLALFEGTQRRVDLGRKSVNATQQAYAKGYLSDVFTALERERPHLLKMLEKGDKSLDANVRREMFELREGGSPGRTGDADAKFLAKTFADMAEKARKDANKLGANIGKLDGWTGPQTHDPARLVKVEPDDWVEAIYPRLDLERMFTAGETETEMRAVLRDIYDTLVTGRDANDTAATRGDFQGPSNMAKALSKSRVLHFKDAEAAESYHQDFGYGTITSGLFGHAEIASRTVAMMEHFGPNPEVMLKSVLDRRIVNIRKSRSIAPEEKAKRMERLNWQRYTTPYDIATGGINNTSPGGGNMAEISASIRSVQSMAKLGGATITAVPTDTVTIAAAAMFRGDGFFGSLFDSIGQIMRGRGTSEQRAIAAALGEGFEGVSGAVTRGLAAEDGPVGHLSWLTTKFFRLNGLTGWTDIARSTAARMVSHGAGRRAGTTFDQLDEPTKNVFRLNGIDAAMWDRIRKTAWTGENGKVYISPDNIPDRADEIAWRRYVWDETTYGVVEMDAAGRRWSALGSNARAGTFMGEAIRFVMQFKGFPLTFTKRILGRAFLGGKGETAAQRILNNAPHIGVVLGGMTVAGYMSLTMKDFIKGAWPPRDPFSPKTMAASLVQGGALGIYGDFLFGDSSNTRNSAAETAIGPTAGTVASVINALARAREGEGRLTDPINILYSNLPGANLFYVRPALDYLLVNSLREAASPGYLRRRERYRRKDYGQELFLNETAF